MTSNWQAIRLGDLAETRRDSGASANAKLYVGLEHLSTGNPRIQGTIDATEVLSSTTAFSEGDVLFGKLRPYLHKVATADFSGCCTNELLVWRPSVDAPISSGFLALTLQSRRATKHAVATSAGSRMPRTSAKLMNDLIVPLPPLTEQRRIVDLIGALDEAIEAADEVIEQAKAVLQRLQGQFSDGESCAIGDLLISIDNGVTTKSSDQAGGLQNQLLVKASAVLPAQFVPSETKPVGDICLPEKARVADGDLLMTRINTPERVGHICRARDTPPNLFRPDLVWRLRLKDNLISADFFEHLMSSKTYRSLVSAAASGTSRSMQQISKGRFASISIVVPSLIEQANYSDRCSAARGVVTTSADYADSLRTLRSELLTSLLSGAHTIPESYDELLETVDA